MKSESSEKVKSLRLSRLSRLTHRSQDLWFLLFEIERRSPCPRVLLTLPLGLVGFLFRQSVLLGLTCSLFRCFPFGTFGSFSFVSRLFTFVSFSSGRTLLLLSKVQQTVRSNYRFPINGGLKRNKETYGSTSRAQSTTLVQPSDELHPRIILELSVPTRQDTRNLLLDSFVRVRISCRYLDPIDESFVCESSYLENRDVNDRLQGQPQVEEAYIGSEYRSSLREL